MICSCIGFWTQGSPKGHSTGTFLSILCCPRERAQSTTRSKVAGAASTTTKLSVSTCGLGVGPWDRLQIRQDCKEESGRLRGSVSDGSDS